MFTDCLSCRRQFRVRASQLAEAEGLVQCGFCGKQFNALERLYDKPRSLDLDETLEKEIKSEPGFIIPETLEANDAVKIKQPDPKAVSIANTFLKVAETELAQSEEAPIRADSEAAIAATGDTASETKVERASLPEDYEVDDDYPFAEELSGIEKQKTRPAFGLFWIFGVLIFLLAGSAQLAWFNRDILISKYPQYLPQAKQICAYFDCTLVRYRNTSAIKLINRDVRVHPRYEDALLVNATITNLSTYSQRYPEILLSLFDAYGKVIAYRQVSASQYLDESIDIEAGMRSDSPIHFTLEMENVNSEAISFEFDFL
jgi:predicted Zn finger-like uncharacterized protein